MKKNEKKIISTALASVMCLSGALTVCAEEADDMQAMAIRNQAGVISPYFVAISSCSRSLNLENGGKLVCKGDTAVYMGYIAEVTVELQKSGHTIKTWSNKPGSRHAVVSEPYYVTNGTYKLKVTHKAYDSAGNVADSFVAYSNEVTY